MRFILDHADAQGLGLVLHVEFSCLIYHTVFPASKIAGCRGIIPLLGEFEGATPPQGLGF
jgi:hypothetical protein